METESVSNVSKLSPAEQVDELFHYLVGVHNEIQKNIIILRYNYIYGKNETQLLYQELKISYDNFTKSKVFQLCDYCNNRLSALKMFPETIIDENHYKRIVQKFKDIQLFTVKYMCFLSRSKNLAMNPLPTTTWNILKKKMKSSKYCKEIYEKLLRKYLNKMNGSEQITAASLADEISILNNSYLFNNVCKVQKLSQMLLYFLAHKVDVPAKTTKSDTTEESTNFQVIKMMRDSLEELIDEMKSLRQQQKTYSEDVNAIKEMSIHQNKYIEDITAIKEMLKNLK